MKNSKKQITVDELAIMVQRGFMEMKEHISNQTKELKSDIEDVKVDLNQRVHVFDYKNLEFRVDRLEEKTGITRRK
jgi:excinuclease UvrABC helicase subunit UvrB